MTSASPSDPTTTFSLSSLSLTLTHPSDIEPHILPLQQSTSFTSISLNGNTLGPSACTALAPHLNSQSSLQTLNLADIFTGRLLSEIPPALSTLLTALRPLSRLERIDLSDNAFGLNTVEPLVEFLRKQVSLRELVLQNNGLGPAAGIKVADALSELAVRKKEAREKGEISVPELEVIICGRNRLESGSSHAWAKALKAHAKGLKEVRMVQNGIRPEGIVVLIREGLGECKGLERVDLQDNTFTVVGARALAGTVGEWKGLKELGVGDCLLGRVGSLGVVKALFKGESQKLEVLRIQYAEMRKEGLDKLVEGVEGGMLEGLRRVEINGNRFSEDEEGVERLREILGERREKAEVDDEEDEGWGVDELDDMEEEEDDEDEEDLEGLDERDVDSDTGVEGGDEANKLEKQKEGEIILKDADEEESENVAQKKDKDVDELADQINKLL